MPDFSALLYQRDHTRGFDTIEEQQLILTHPITGFYARPDGHVGIYSIWHPLCQLTFGQPEYLYFKLLANLQLLTDTKMQHPHSILLQSEILYQIQLPPQLL